MSDFNPGPEWQELLFQEIQAGQRYMVIVDSDLARRPDIRRYYVQAESS